MEDLVKFGYKYNLTMNEKIILLAQFNHIIEVLGKRRFLFNHLLGQILAQVNAEMQNPPDLIW
jgi:dTDP-4-amino-4,6-dideoxygalactose transaminase